MKKLNFEFENSLSFKEKGMAKQTYNSYYYSKRILQLIQLNSFVIEDVKLRMSTCEPDYIDEVLIEANELLEQMTAENIKLFVTTRDLTPDSFHTFIEYARIVIEKFISNKIKLHNDDYIESIIVTHERNIHN